MRIIFTVLSFLIIVGCTPISDIPKTDLKIATANILISTNKNIEQDLLEMDCDIYLLHEAVIGVNINSGAFTDRGYSVYSHTTSSINAFNGVLITRLTGDFQSLDLKYYYDANYEPTLVAPFYSFDFIYNSRALSVIGVHIPPEIFMPQELKKLRDDAIRDISSGINNGRDTLGREVILAGDFNTLPSDNILDPILDSNLEDAILYSDNRYDKTWKPTVSPIDLARIDYIFVSKNLNTRYLDSSIIDGSDHKALVVGIDVK